MNLIGAAAHARSLATRAADSAIHGDGDALAAADWAHTPTGEWAVVQ